MRITTACVLVFLIVRCFGQKKELRILGLQPMTGESLPGGWSCLVPVWMALDDINKHPDILPGYVITYDYVDHECMQGTAIFKMVQKLQEGPPYVLLTGPLLSTIATATAQVSYHWNITQISFAASSPVLSNRIRFPKFYRMSTPETKDNPTRVAILKHFNWNKIATIHHAVEFFSVVIDDLVEDILANNITVTSQQVFLHDPTTQVQKLKMLDVSTLMSDVFNKGMNELGVTAKRLYGHITPFFSKGNHCFEDDDARIIFTAMYEDRARAVLCEAYKIGLYGPKIVWFFFGFLSKTFWKTKLEGVSCTLKEMQRAADGLFLIRGYNIYADNKTGPANMTNTEFYTAFRSHPKYNAETKTYDSLADNCFDGTWLASLALNCTVNKLHEIGHPKTLDQFNYTDSDINEIIFQCVGETSLVGVSGWTFFPNGGDPDRNAKILRVQNDERVVVAYFRKDLNPNRFEWVEGALKWKDGNIPRDSTVVTKKEVILPNSLYIAMCTIATLGILLAIFFLIFNISFRNNRSVKMSSPNMNNVLLFGCIMCYIIIFIKSIEVSNAVLCKIRVFCFCLGFTTTFGSLFSRTWRVYRIFTNKKLMRVSIRDIQLFAINGVLAAVVLIVVVIWEIVAPHHMIVRVLTKEFYTIGNDEEVQPFVRVCYSEYSTFFGWTIYILEGALLTFGAFLAWETKHIKIAALNDSHQIGLCLYNVVILSAVGLTLTLLLDEQEVLLYGVTSGCLIIGTTLTQLVVFVPKIYVVYMKIDINDSDTGMTAGTSTGISQSRKTTVKSSLSGAPIIYEKQDTTPKNP